MKRLRIVWNAALAVALCLGGTVPAFAQSGLVAAYGFDEGSGSTVNDSSGQGNNGVVSGAAWTTTGKFGGALSFDGVSSWVTVPHSAALALTKGMTIEAWIRTASPAGWRAIALKERTGGLSYALYGGDLNGHPAGFVHRTSDLDATGPSALPTNVWTHVATTYDGATLRTYVNGVQVATRAVTGNIAASTLPPHRRRLHLGRVFCRLH